MAGRAPKFRRAAGSAGAFRFAIVAARFNERLNAFHHVARVVLDVLRKRFAFVVGVSALARDVDHAVVNDERRNETGSRVGLAFISQFLNPALRLPSRNSDGGNPRFRSADFS